MKESPFTLKLAGIDNSPVPILYHLEGDYSVLYKINNTVERSKGDSQQYSELHKSFTELLKVLGQGYTIQKQDIFTKDIDVILAKEDETLAIHQTYLVITKNITKSSFFEYKKKDFKDFLDKITLSTKVLTESHLSPTILNEEEIVKLTNRFVSQDFTSKEPILQNFKVHDNRIDFTKKSLKIISLVDVDETHFPTTIKPFSKLDIVDDSAEVDIVSFIHGTPYCDNIIYNQVIRIPDQKKSISAYKSKIKRHSNIPDPSNDVCVADAEYMLNLIETSQDLLVQCHFGILLYGDSDRIEKANTYLESNLHRIGIIPSNNAYIQKTIFENSFPGHTSSLHSKFDLFESMSKPALCLFYKEKTA